MTGICLNIGTREKTVGRFVCVGAVCSVQQHIGCCCCCVRIISTRFQRDGGVLCMNDAAKAQ